MPTYDFRCSECRAAREVRASMGESADLELVCLECGGTMTKGVARTVGLLASSSGPAPSPPALAARQPTCADGAVRLQRPNPFRGELPRDPVQPSRRGRGPTS